MIQIRLVNRGTDYPMLCEWWKGHGWPALPIHVLPKLGAVATDEGVEVAAAFLYMDNSSPVCMLEWFVTSPTARPLSAMKGVTALVEFMMEQALAFDYTVMMGATKTRSIGAVLGKAGFIKSDEGVTHFVRILKEET